MKSNERQNRSLVLDGALAETPIKGVPVREGHDALTKANASVTRSELAFASAKQVKLDASARVRDATKRANVECRKARGTLVGEGLEPAPHVIPTGHTPRALIRRADLLLGRAVSGGVKLHELQAARDALSAALAAQASARAAKAEASAAQDSARAEWDAAYTSLRAVIEAELRRGGLRAEKLTERLSVYFPHSVARQPAPAAPVAPRLPVRPEGEAA